MAPRKKATTSATGRPRRSTRQARKPQNNIPNVYEEMLAEAAATDEDGFPQSSRPIKRRKVSVEQDDEVDALFESPPPPISTPPPEAASAPSPTRELQGSQQIVYDDFEGSEESDVEFEDVELDPAIQSASDTEELPSKSLEIDLNKSALLETPKRTAQVRKPISKAERLMRLDVHKWHLMSLVAHGLYRNSWCNHDEVHAILKPLVSRKIIKLLHGNESEPKYQRNYSFNKGIEEICALWHHEWKTTIPGLRRSYWREDVDARSEVDEMEDLDFEDFTTAAQTRSGSRDLGAQLFTALLRSVAIDARLVFSLQVLPFTGAAKAETPRKNARDSSYIQAPAQNYGVSATQSSPFAPPSRAKKPKTKKIVDSPYPVFWTEVLTPNQNWIPLDPVVRNTISKPKTQFEPASSDSLNTMTYVVAYEDDNSVKDVTRRYTQWYNAKTRKSRVESTKNGEEWYTSALDAFKKRLREPRDEIEDGELINRASSEGMPHNVQDFKGHPVYVLERHLRANEVLHPKREVGKMNVGTAKNGKIESVYRRQDVHLCRSADAWYRRGRDVRFGEQPLKIVQPKTRKDPEPRDNAFSDEEDEGDEGVGLYAEYQTDVYEPPPVVNNKIPKNAYGNLDVYVPSMIPAGAVHISHALAASAARLIGVDFADAVVGFEFKGRQGTAVVKGIVTAQGFTAAIASVIDGLELIGSEQVQLARANILQNIWKRMLQALRVRERIEAEYGSKNTDVKQRNDDESDDDHDDGDEDSAYEDEDEDAGGGFVPEDEPTEEKVQDQEVRLQALKSKAPIVLPDEVVRVPISIARSPHKLPQSQTRKVGNEKENDNDTDDLFEEGHQNTNEAHEFMPKPFPSQDTKMAGGFLTDENDGDDGGGGGFLPENDDDIEKEDDEIGGGGGGGFMPETKPSSSSKPSSHPTTTIMITDNNIHSDNEEDSALQQAIANSLSTTQRQQKQSLPKTQEISAVPTSTSISISENINTQIEKDRTKTTISTSEEHAGLNHDRQPDNVSSSSQNSHSQSLLSHDPNEDDEEPDWLNEALD